MGTIALLKVAKNYWKELLGGGIILLILFPLLMFSTGITVASTVPAIDETQMRIYLETSNEVGDGKSFINYKDVISIDAVRYNQEFSKSNRSNVKALTERFLQEHREEINYNFSSYKNAVDILNSELGVNIDWREVAMVDALLTGEKFGKSDIQIKDLARKFYRIYTEPYNVSVTKTITEEVVTSEWVRDDDAPSWFSDWMCQTFGWGEWVEHRELVNRDIVETTTEYREVKEALSFDKVLLDLGHNADQIPPFFKSKDSMTEQMQKVIITYTTKSLEEVMTELGMTSEEIQRARTYRDVGMNVLNGAGGGQGGGGVFDGSGETPSGSVAEFIDRVSPGSIETQNKYGVCASISISQAILESGWGKSGLTTKANNLFGIKADSGWSKAYVEMNTQEYDGGGAYTIVARFRAYATWAESIDDHGSFLKNNSRYGQHGLFNSTDYISQAYALKAAGYATDPNYPLQLIELIRTYGLYKYDK